MTQRIVLISGHVGAGKTTLAEAMAARFGFVHLSTRALLKGLEPTADRRTLQKLGDELDRRTRGTWVLDSVLDRLSRNGDAKVVVDAVRTTEQIEAFRREFGSAVTHVHLLAPLDVLENRYRERARTPVELDSYASVLVSETERRVASLDSNADLVVDTGSTSEQDVATELAAHLRLYGANDNRLVDVVVGGQFGSEGKGNICSYLAAEYSVLVRVGGPNAGHRVFATPTPYTFHHLPSGTMHSSAIIILGAGAVLRVHDLLSEIRRFAVSSERLAIDPNAMLIEDDDVAGEEELRRSIGSTARGVGRATARKVLRGLQGPPVRLAKDVAELRPFIRDTQTILERAFANQQRVLVEGTQGTHLSLHHGSYPYVTSRDTTVSGTLGEAGIAAPRVRRVVMVCRTYPIRVQNPADSTSGPMGREITWATVASRSGIPLEEILATERTSTTGRLRRVAEFDWSLLRRSASLNGVTDVALTFADYISIANREARRYDQLTPDTKHFVERLERVSGAPVSLISTRFRHRRIIDRRNW